MSNLGAYQTMVELAKKVGGPWALAAIVAGGGGLLLRGAEAGGKAALRQVRARNQSNGAGLQERPVQFTVATDADCGSGLTLHAGDKIRVLARHGDAVWGAGYFSDCGCYVGQAAFWCPRSWRSTSLGVRYPKAEYSRV